LKIENCENVEFYDKLKPLTYLIQFSLLMTFQKKFNVLTLRNSNLFSRVLFQFFGSNSGLGFNSNQGSIHGLVFLPVHQIGVGLGLFRSQELEPLWNHKKLQCFPPFIFSSFLWDNLQWNLMPCVRSPSMGQHDLTTFCKPIMFLL
jgi:hypothetical protein